MRAIFVDIDGTLTEDGGNRWGKPRMDLIRAVRHIVARCEVVLWSGAGGRYAQAFADKYEIPAAAAVSKPDAVFDDGIGKIRPNLAMAPIEPPEMLEMYAGMVPQ